jgi:anti-anti-sigma factor
MSLQPHSPPPAERVSDVDLRVEARPAGRETLVVTVHGEIDVATAPVLREALERALDARQHVVVDLDNATFMDATTLDLLVQAGHRASATGATVCVRCESDHGRLLFKTVGLEHLLD